MYEKFKHLKKIHISLIPAAGHFNIEILATGSLKHPKMQADAKYFINFTYGEGDPDVYNKIASQIEMLL